MNKVTQIKTALSKNKENKELPDISQVTSETPIPEETSDAYLLGLIDEHSALIQAFRKSPNPSDTTSDYYMDRLMKIEREIIKQRPVSLEGVNRKTQMAWDEWLSDHPKETHDGGDRLVHSVFKDITNLQIKQRSEAETLALKENNTSAEKAWDFYRNAEGDLHDVERVMQMIYHCNDEIGDEHRVYLDNCLFEHLQKIINARHESMGTKPPAVAEMDSRQVAKAA